MPFDDTTAAQGLGLPLTKIFLRYGNVINAIQAFYGDAQTPLTYHGDPVGEVPVAAGDPIAHVSGFYGSWFGGNYILQLTFVTSGGKTYGPFGNMDYGNTRTPFTFDLQPNERLITFFASTAYPNNRQWTFIGSLGITVGTGLLYSLNPQGENQPPTFIGSSLTLLPCGWYGMPMCRRNNLRRHTADV